jgi:hypothetical protein
MVVPEGWKEGKTRKGTVHGRRQEKLKQLYNKDKQIFFAMLVKITEKRKQFYENPPKKSGTGEKKKCSKKFNNENTQYSKCKIDAKRTEKKKMSIPRGKKG